MGSINHERAREFLHLRPEELEETDRQALQAHLAGCPDCQIYANSLAQLQPRLRTAFHNRWDDHPPMKSNTGRVIIRLGRENKRLRISALVGTLVGVLALITLVFVLDFVVSNLRPQPAILPIISTSTQSFKPTSSPSKASTVPTRTSVTSSTPLPEGTIVLNFWYSILPLDAEAKAYGDYWANALSNASGLNVVAVPGPSTDMDILQALRYGKIQLAELDALAFAYGQAQGWIVPGPVSRYTYQPDGRLMFVSRKDAGLVAGESPQMYQQLAGKRPCYPDMGSFYQLPLYEYIAPAGFLAQKGVKLGQPVFNTHPRREGMLEAELVFLKECDFAVFESEPTAGFMSLWFPDLVSKGFNFNDWTKNMQVLFYTPSVVPYHIMAFSSQLDASEREKLTNALLSVPTTNTEIHWVPYDSHQAAFYNQFQDIVEASGVDIASYLNWVWDPQLKSILSTTLTPSPVP